VWPAPVSAVGLLLSALALHRGHAAVVDGVLEAHGPLLRWVLKTLVPIPGGAAAITFGHVVLGTSRCALDATRAHERVHVRQYERWGPLFPALYLLACAWAFARGGDAYWDNTFERDARVRARS
jgi:hypothetical protein